MTQIHVRTLSVALVALVLGLLSGCVHGSDCHSGVSDGDQCTTAFCD